MRQTEDQVVTKFWAEQRAKRERREAIEAMPRGHERMAAVMADVWTTGSLARLLDSPILFRNPANDLDEWLAERERIPQVREALGIRQPWEAKPGVLHRLRALLERAKVEA